MRALDQIQSNHKLLLIAGTREAQDLALWLSKMPKFDVLATVHGDARLPRDLPVKTRFGPFQNESHFESLVSKSGFHALIDASHPFATDITEQALAISQRQNLGFMQFERKEWTATPEDRWITVKTEHDVKKHLSGCRKIMTFTGRSSIDKFMNIENIYIYNRILQAEGSAFPLSNGEHLYGQPPFSVEQEIALFQRLDIDAIVLRNVGGKNGFSKLAAARALGLLVIMIERPKLKTPPPLRSLSEAQHWIETNYG